MENERISYKEKACRQNIDCLSATELQEKPFQVIIFDYQLIGLAGETTCYRRLHRSVDTRQITCSNRVSHMTCFAAKVWQPVKQTVAPKESCLYVFDQCFHSYFIFLNRKTYFSLRNSLLAYRNYTYRLKIPLKNILLSENKSSRKQPLTPNFEYLATKHVLIGCPQVGGWAWG